MKFKYLMKFLIHASVLLAIFFFVPGCKPESKVVDVVQKYGSGEVSRTYKTIDGKKEGPMKDFYPGGGLKRERLFENDIQVGKATMYHKNGAIKEVQYFKDGKVHGGDTIFYDTGKPEMVVTFNTGAKDGFVRKWAPDGTLIYEAKYANEVLVEVKGEKINPDSLEKN